MNEGPGWTIVSIIQHQLVISETASCEGYYKKFNERID